MSEDRQTVNGIPVFTDDDYSAEELEEIKEQSELYQANHQTILSTNTMPDLPINPSIFVSKVTNELQSKNVFVSSDTKDVIQSLCKLLNQNIQDNNEKQTYTVSSYVYPAQTGIGKSLSLQIYVSMLEEYSSLIVVSKVDEAIKYCEYINKLSSNPDYARCYYGLSDKNKNSDVRVEKWELNEYRCIVLTHSMFKVANSLVDVNIYKFYNEMQRDLIVIDEKLNMYEQFSVDKKDIEFLTLKVKELVEKDEYKEYKTTVFKFLEAINNLFIGLEEGFKKASRPTLLFTDEATNKYFEHFALDPKACIQELKELLLKRVDELFAEIKQLANISNNNFLQTVKTRSEKLPSNLEVILKDWFVYYKDNYKNSIFVINNIASKLGISVVLDATANVNEYYNVANRFFGRVGFVEAAQIRKYSNLTIYKNEGLNQSRYAIYKQEKKDIKINTLMYASFINSVLNKVDDKLLVITYKKFLPHLQLEVNDNRVVFTNWGNHVGKNEWSDCNKVMVIGWYFLPTIEHISNYYSAVEKIDEAGHYIDKEVIKNFELSQLADDLIQAVMRSKARVIATKDSDCHKTEVYLFYKKKEDSLKVLDLFEKAFPKANIVDWKPNLIIPIGKKTKPQQKVDAIISLLKTKESKHQTYLLSDVIKNLEIDKTTMGRLVNSDYFKEQLKKSGYSYTSKDGKSKHFVLG